MPIISPSDVSGRLMVNDGRDYFSMSMPRGLSWWFLDTHFFRLRWCELMWWCRRLIISSLRRSRLSWWLRDWCEASAVPFESFLFSDYDDEDYADVLMLMMIDDGADDSQNIFHDWCRFSGPDASIFSSYNWCRWPISSDFFDWLFFARKHISRCRFQLSLLTPADAASRDDSFRFSFAGAADYFLVAEAEISHWCFFRLRRLITIDYRPKYFHFRWWAWCRCLIRKIFSMMIICRNII